MNLEKSTISWIRTQHLKFYLLFAVSSEFCSANLWTVSYFDFESLKKATKNFHPANLLGKGGFGPVYQVLILNPRKWWSYLLVRGKLKVWKILCFHNVLTHNILYCKHFGIQGTGYMNDQKALIILLMSPN